jgi:hypothetical protein
MPGATAPPRDRGADRGLGPLVATDVPDEADVTAAVAVSFRKRATANDSVGESPMGPAVTIFPSGWSTEA